MQLLFDSRGRLDLLHHLGITALKEPGELDLDYMACMADSPILAIFVLEKECYAECCFTGYGG